MNKRTFLALLVLIAVALVAWVGCTSTQKTVAPVDANAIGQQWWGSAHADIKSEVFSHWNGEEPAEGEEVPSVPTSCAKCHSTSGFVDYIGGDGTEANKVDNPGVIMQGVQCGACHNAAAATYTDVTLPSGSVLKAGGDAVCSTCHSGMGSGPSVDKNKLVVAAGAGADDTVLEKSSLMSAHYAMAAATHAGTDGKSGYEYAGKTYVGTFAHDEKVNQCTECHDPHTLWIKENAAGEAICSACHVTVKTYADYRTVPGKVDYDGNGKVEPVATEIQGMETLLKAAITKYSSEKLGKALGFNFDAYPYAYVDTNVDGKIDETEGVFANGYNTFSPRLLRAGFNLMFSHKEPGAYVHNAKYVLQLMYDSIADLGGDVAGLTRP
jgi:hypothetical protein